MLDYAGVEFEIDPTLVRGLDYYTRTVFEFTSDALGAQSGVGGGGRYDGLVERLGGPPTPAVGWAAGVERILLASQAGSLVAGSGEDLVFVALDGEGLERTGFRLLTALWRAGARAEMEQAGRSLKGQLKHASRLGARAAILVAEDGLRVRDMRTREEEPASDLEHAVALATPSPAPVEAVR